MQYKDLIMGLMLLQKYSKGGNVPGASEDVLWGLLCPEGKEVTLVDSKLLKEMGWRQTKNGSWKAPV